MAILAMRERRRFNQCRRLGLEIPDSYVRIYSFVKIPKNIQKEILTYQSCIYEDSEYEKDEIVLKKYKGMTYPSNY